MNRSALLALALLAGCTSPASDATSPDSRSVVVPQVRITPTAPRPASYSRLVRPDRIVIGERAAFQDVWSHAFEVPAPEVDFRKEIVLVAAMGEKPSGGYSIEISQVRREGSGDLVVDVVSTFPSGGPVSEALTQPVDFVRIPYRIGQRVRFVESTPKR